MTAELPTHCSQCGRPLDRVEARHGFDPHTGQPDTRYHRRCPKKVTTSWQAEWRGDHHDEIIEPTEKGPFAAGDPGPLLIEVKWG